MHLGRIVFVILLIVGARTATAQGDISWLQIEARPTLTTAEERARDYAGRLDDVNGFRLSTGWYAIALGPYSADEAPAILSNLRANGLIPRDSYIQDGTSFGVRFWPVGAGFTNLPRPAPAQEAPQATDTTATIQTPAPAPSSTFTIADARADERSLSRDERQDIQRALQYEGVYSGAIDGAFGPGTRRAISAWQARTSRPDWGYLAPDQREALLTRYQEEVGALGIANIADEAAGIEITLPASLVSFEEASAPFSRYTSDDGSGVEVLLISQTGDRASLAALFDIMQTLRIVPSEGPRELRRDSFTISGSDGRFSSFTFARLERGEIKGYTLVWPVGDERRRDLVLAQMRAGFRALPGQVLPIDDVVARRDGPNYLSGLEIRRPVRARSGFFVSPDGKVLTTSEAVGGCGRITLGEDGAAQIVSVDADTGLVLLSPADPLVPMAYARIANSSAPQLTEIAVAGFSFEGALGAPSISYGNLAQPSGFDGQEAIARLSLTANAGDSGGPILTSDGAVVAMLLPRNDDTRRLPRNTELAVNSDRMSTFLSEAGVTPLAITEATPVDADTLAALASDMTVLVSCWN